MTGPRLFFGRSDSDILLLQDGYDDAGQPYTMLARTNRSAPAGAGGECIFTNAYLTVRHDGPVALVVTPIVDEVRYEPQVVVLPATGGQALLEVREIALTTPYSREGIERGRFALRGAWVQLEVELLQPFTDVVVELVEIEYEPVRESKQP